MQDVALTRSLCGIPSAFGERTRKNTCRSTKNTKETRLVQTTTNVKTRHIQRKLLHSIKRGILYCEVQTVSTLNNTNITIGTQYTNRASKTEQENRVPWTNCSQCYSKLCTCARFLEWVKIITMSNEVSRIKTVVYMALTSLSTQNKTKEGRFSNQGSFHPILLILISNRERWRLNARNSISSAEHSVSQKHFA